MIGKLQLGLIKRQQTFWNQRILNKNNVHKKNWYRRGYRNTQYFHACAFQRKRKNHIKQLIVKNNQVISSHDDLDKEFMSYFQHIYKSSHPSLHDINDCLVNIKETITSEMNLELTKQYTINEIQVALSQMGLLKSPGPYGFNAGFF